MLIAATSDLHGYLPEIPTCDVLLIAGDVCPVWNHALPFQREWLRGEFSDWLSRAPAGRIVGVAGNHDLALADDPALGGSLPWTYLENETAEVLGLTIWGSPLANRFSDGWAFLLIEEPELEAVWETIPDNADIVMTHGPAFGLLDETRIMAGRTGSKSLRARLVEVKPKLHVCGHFHESYGSDTLGLSTRAFNVSHCNYRVENGRDIYEPVNPVVRIEL